LAELSARQVISSSSKRSHINGAGQRPPANTKTRILRLLSKKGFEIFEKILEILGELTIFIAIIGSIASLELISTYVGYSPFIELVKDFAHVWIIIWLILYFLKKLYPIIQKYRKMVNSITPVKKR
jgi:hypothetical protein